MGNLIITIFFKTPWKGAQTTIYSAVAEELEGVSGKFFADCAEIKLTVSNQDAERLWDLKYSAGWIELVCHVLYYC